MNWRKKVGNMSWLKQTPDNPAFPNLLWSKPENARARGKLLIVGGNLHSFSAVSEAYQAAQQAGIGMARAVLPEALQKSLGQMFPEAVFAPSNLSGGLSRESLATLLDESAWADGVLLAGDFGKNSETQILIESFAAKYSGPLVITGDSADFFLNSGHGLKERAATLVLEFSQLQKLAATQAVTIKNTDTLARIVELLGGLTTHIKASVAAQHNNHFLVASDGNVCTSPGQASIIWLAAYSAVWQLQHPGKIFEAISCAVLE